jgi:hypothetical protein
MISKYTWHRFQCLACIALGLTSGLLVSCNAQFMPFDPNTPAKAEMKRSFSKVINIGTDVATWFLFHPQDLVHRNKDPLDWWAYDFAFKKEFASGNLIAVDTGADGGFSIRLTDQDLTTRERTYATYSKKFRLQVRHDRLFLDGGYALNADEQTDKPEDFPDQWIEISNGNYEVTVHVLAWHKEPGTVDQDGNSTKNSLPSYVVVFKPVDNLETIAIPEAIPRIEPDYYSEEYIPITDSSQQPIKREYPALVRPNIFFPSLEANFSITTSEHKQLERLNKFEDSQFSFVISSSLEPQTIATLFRLNAYTGQDYPDQRFEVFGVNQQLLRIVRSYEKNGMSWAEVKPYDPPSSPAADSTLRDRLKQLFADYAATDTGYQNRIKHHRFYAERVASLTKSIEVAWAVANALDLPLATQRELITLSEKELLQRLIRILDEK